MSGFTTQHDLAQSLQKSRGNVLDPGDGGTIVLPYGGFMRLAIKTSGAETRAQPIPKIPGQMLLVYMKVDGGDCVVTVASAYNEAGDTIYELTDEGQKYLFQAVEVDSSGTLAWRLIAGPTGTTSEPVESAVADRRFLYHVFKHTGASGDNRAHYLRLYLTGGGGGEALRAFTTVEAAGTGTAHGAHLSLNFDATNGTLTGQGIAARCTLHIPNRVYSAGTLAALQGEIYMDGTSADPSGIASSLGIFRAIVDGGDATARARVKNFLIATVPAGSGNMFETGLTAATINAATTGSLKIVINGTDYYIPIATANS